MNVTELDKKHKDRINTEIKNTLINTELNKGNKRTGKVRDQYALDDKIILISDFFIDDFVGGAALNDEEIFKLLSKRFDVYKIKSPYLYEGFIQENLDSFFIISNFFGINFNFINLTIL